MAIEVNEHYPTETTLAFRDAWEQFSQEVELELKSQINKRNRNSEVRMRKLLRDFNKRIYVPYRDGSLGKGE